MEGIAILHDEFPPAHDAETGANLVAELGLDLVEMQWQLAIALYFLAHHIGNHLFVRRADDKVALVTVLQAQQFGTIFVPAPGLLPQFTGLHGGHQHLDGPGTVHFLTDDVFHLAQHAQAGRHDGIDATSQPFDDTGAQHEFMADDFSVSRSFLERGDEKPGGAHVLGLSEKA